MRSAVAASAQRHQILFGIIAEQTARLNVMYLEFTHGSAILTTPAIPPQYFLSEMGLPTATRSSRSRLLQKELPPGSWSQEPLEAVAQPNFRANRINNLAGLCNTL